MQKKSKVTLTNEIGLVSPRMKHIRKLKQKSFRSMCDWRRISKQDVIRNEKRYISRATDAYIDSNPSKKSGSVHAHKEQTTVQSTSKQVPISIEKQHLLNSYISRAMDAHRNRCLFCVHEKCQTVKALQRRGWLQKNLPYRHEKLKNLSIHTLLNKVKPGNEYEAALFSEILNKFPANFVWMPVKQPHDMIGKLAYRNRRNRGHSLDYTTKIGLVGCIEQEHWYRQEGVCEMSYPRCYRMGGKCEEHIAFIDDFRRTQCRNFAQFIVDYCDKPRKIIDEKSGKVYLSDVMFALDNLRLQLNDLEAISLKNNKDNNIFINTAKWKSFIEKSSLVINKKAKIKATPSELSECTVNAVILLCKLKNKRPDYKWDGLQNLWILKPGFRCRGVGIKVENSLKEILEFADKNKKLEYIVQKYVERPLLIYKTKFDIRLYVLLTYNNKVVRIWLYEDCYLRFSSQKFSLHDLRSSIHLTNHAVQKPYKKYMKDSHIPKNLMWSLEDFKQYLREHNAPPNTWEEHIFPVFRKTIIAVILSSLVEMDLKANTFDFTGCDFMLDQQYNPFLIEFNYGPDLSPSTTVTQNICPMVQEDLIKVLVDLPANSHASTGKFQLIYQLEHNGNTGFKPKLNMDICGKSMKIPT